MINSSVKDRIAAIQGKIIEGNQLKSCNQTEPLWKSLISSDCQLIFTQDRELLSDYFQIRRDSFHNDKYMRGHFHRGEPGFKT